MENESSKERRCFVEGNREKMSRHASKKMSPGKVFFRLTIAAFLWDGNTVAVKKVLTDLSLLAITLLRFAVFSSILLLAAWHREGRKFLPKSHQLRPSFYGILQHCVEQWRTV